MTVTADATYLDAIAAALRDELEADPGVVLLGEDIGVLGGAFRVTAGLLETYGSERVIDTPIAEAARSVPASEWQSGTAPRGRDSVRRLHLLRLRPARHGGGQALLPVRNPGADRRPLPLRGRPGRRALPLTEPGGSLRAHPWYQSRMSGHRPGRLRHPESFDRRPQPSTVRRAQGVVSLASISGFGAEVAARLSEESFFDLDAPVLRVADPDAPAPAASRLEEAYIPSVARIEEAVWRTLAA